MLGYISIQQESHHPSYFRHQTSFTGIWLSFIHKQINKKLMNTKYKKLEDALLNATDLLIEKAKSQGEKMVFELFKSAILKKYKDLFDKEFSEGAVHKETIDDAVEYCYTDICVSIRQIPKMNETEKEHMIQLGKQAKETVKPIIEKQLIKDGINIE